MSAPLRFAHIDAATIAVLVHEFYARIRRHPVLGPVFEANIAPAEWPGHLATMCRFWSSVMLTTGEYSGNPVAVHRAVSGMDTALFPQWLALFGETASDLFDPAQAEAFLLKARRIAASLETAVFFRPGLRVGAAALVRPIGG